MMTTDANLSERRQYPRTQLHMPVQAITLDFDGPDRVDQFEMVDISRGGVGIVSQRSLYPGQRLLLKLPAPGMGVRSLCGIIRRCRPQEGKYLVGVEFDQPLASLCGDASIAAA